MVEEIRCVILPPLEIHSNKQTYIYEFDGMDLHDIIEKLKDIKAEWVAI